MGASQVPATASIPSDNWVLISSVTPTASATTVTFSSIALTKKLMIRMNGANPGTGTVTVTFNGDSGANYSLYGLGLTSTGSLVSPYGTTDATGLALGTSVNSLNGVLTIEESDTTNIKNIWGYARVGNPSGASVYPDIQASYKASAAISSITITTTSTFTASGTIAIYGVSA